ncbi:hypothetical protein BJY00DRAFT_302285 [Aspergillus carlsbadensis]|nr:hypothetical protein BJY00DRAFT_302285 [Aspergillus carlsbadensis]
MVSSTTSEKVDAIERIFAYSFKSKELLIEALTAAGIGEGDKYDGHRRLAQVGVDVIGICLSMDGLETKSNPHKVAILRQELCSYEHRIYISQRTDIDKYVIYNPKSGENSPKVAAKALAAIFAAIYLDCGNHHDTWERMRYIGCNAQVSQVNNNSNPRKRAAECLWTGDESIALERSQSTKGNWDEFLHEELQKCRATGHLSPEESYYNTSIQGQIQQLKNERSIDICKRLLLLIASSQSILMLRDVIQSWRNQQATYLNQPLRCLSKAATFEVIEGLDRNIACLRLIRRYYILSLFQECGGSETPSCSGFIDISGNPNTVKRLRGNPLNRAESEVAVAMLKEMFPDMQAGTREYDRKIMLVKQYRQSARRFTSLVNQFGKGILALIPCGEVEGRLVLYISDNMISRVPEQSFNTILCILDQSQGDVLRQFAAAALDFVEILLSGSPQQVPVSAFETVDADRVLQQPKNSTALLHCLKGNSTADKGIS